VSSEKNDMELPDSTVNIRRIVPVERPLRCVWTSHPDREHCCHSLIPAQTVTTAWRRELELGRACAGFFHFAWHGHVWLAYGMPDGGVRGVYCPTHRAEREQRLGYDPELVLRVAAGYAV